ncbi:hypothetical protein E2C01_003340 [Portunus trituberculatus]|uniref:Uncharacterized protein n=1 Tax=Portunus trituberculatus TaxID=210409 RepID=A0A5B7CMH0_PORTR|nr:hypothetical protein [Portunus trituberculatus]
MNYLDELKNEACDDECFLVADVAVVVRLVRCASVLVRAVIAMYLQSHPSHPRHPRIYAYSFSVPFLINHLFTCSFPESKNTFDTLLTLRFVNSRADGRVGVPRSRTKKPSQS